MKIKNKTPMYALLIPFVFAGLQMAQSASADSQPTMNQLANSVQTSCQTDINQFCSDVTPGHGRILSCLNSKQDQLSDGCRVAKATAEENISQRMDKANVAFRKDCGSDVQKYCADVPSGQGRVLECLSHHKADLSNSCSKFQAKLEQKLSEFLS